MWIITKFTGSTLVRRPSAVNPYENSCKPHMLCNRSGYLIIPDTNRPSSSISRHMTVDFYRTTCSADVHSVDTVWTFTGLIDLRTVTWSLCKKRIIHRQVPVPWMQQFNQWVPAVDYIFFYYSDILSKCWTLWQIISNKVPENDYCL